MQQINTMGVGKPTPLFKMRAIFVTVRTGSKRLPHKAMRRILRRPCIELLIERMKRVQSADMIVLCTTELQEDNRLCRIAQQSGIKYFRGSEDDKLVRWRDAAKHFDIDFFVTADGDDLLCDPALVETAFIQYNRTKPDLIESKTTPCGAFTYGIKTEALNKICENKKSQKTEMIRDYFNGFKVEQLTPIFPSLKRPEIRMTLDYPDDLEFFRIIFNNLDEPFLLEEVIMFLDKNPWIMKINGHLQKDYLMNQERMCSENSLGGL